MSSDYKGEGVTPSPSIKRGRDLDGRADSYDNLHALSTASDAKGSPDNDGNNEYHSPQREHVGSDDKSCPNSNTYSPTDSSSNDSSPKYAPGSSSSPSGRYAETGSARDVEREEEIKGSSTNIVQYAIDYCESAYFQAAVNDFKVK